MQKRLVGQRTKTEFGGATLARVVQEDLSKGVTTELKDIKEPILPRRRDVYVREWGKAPQAEYQIGHRIEAEVSVTPSKAVSVCVHAWTKKRKKSLIIINKCPSQSRLWPLQCVNYLSLSKYFLPKMTVLEYPASLSI